MVSEETFSIEVDPGKKFARAITKAASEVDDLTIPYILMTKDWFKSNRAIFSLVGPGKYADLKPSYKKEKQAAVGFVYPILRRSGQLERSLTEPGDKGSIAEIINKKTLILGTRDRTAVWHQEGTKRGLPARPSVLLGAEQVSPSGINRRREAWVAILDNYIAQVLAKTDA